MPELETQLHNQIMAHLRDIMVLSNLEGQSGAPVTIMAWPQLSGEAWKHFN